MHCGRVSPMSSRSSFEELATLFEGSGTSGAERAYRKALDKLTTILVEEGILHAVHLKRKNITRKKKEIATAIYLYQVDFDGEWGEIYFDFVNQMCIRDRIYVLGCLHISRVFDYGNIIRSNFL